MSSYTPIFFHLLMTWFRLFQNKRATHNNRKFLYKYQITGTSRLQYYVMHSIYWKLLLRIVWLFVTLGTISIWPWSISRIRSAVIVVDVDGNSIRIHYFVATWWLRTAELNFKRLTSLANPIIEDFNFNYSSALTILESYSGINEFEVTVNSILLCQCNSCSWSIAELMGTNNLKINWQLLW